MRILAVDDDRAILELLIEALAVSGYLDVVTANSGEAAIKAIELTDDPFDCFLLDIQMPGMDGVELCRQIRERPGYRNKPIVMVTAMSQKSYIDRAFTAGATDYITKPFDFLEVGMRLSLAQKQASEMAAPEADTGSAFEPAYSLCEPIEILNLDHVVGYVAFDNYVMQLTRSHLFLSSVYAVKINGVEAINTKSTPTEFRELITNVASVILDNTDTVGSLLTYRGNGVFLCMTHKSSKQAHLELENTLQEKACDLPLPYAPDAPLPELQLIVGEQISLSVLFRSGSLAHLRRAIENVETKALFLKDMETVLDKGNAAEERAMQIHAQKKVGYEAFLRESLSEGISLQEMRQT
ncbi:MAG: CheY-like chemotaxis protein [Paracoccaceae bacterium]|jgi:CheY-like chemotaxis protein